MNSNNNNRVVVPFINRTHPVWDKFRQQGLLDLALPAALGHGGAFLLAGENILLPAAGQPRQRYACCAYVVSTDGRKALPVIGCRAWFHAPLPAQPHTHPVWDDLGGGLVEAANRLGDAMFDLNGAIVAARSWMSRRHDESAARAGSALLLGHGTHVHCAALTMTPPPPAAAAVVQEVRAVRSLPQRWSLTLPESLPLAA